MAFADCPATPVWFNRIIMRTLLLLVVATVAVSADAPQSLSHHRHDVTCSSCPFVDSRSGLECLGIPLFDGYSPAGQKYKCSRGHRWIERN